MLVIALPRSSMSDPLYRRPPMHIELRGRAPPANLASVHDSVVAAELGVLIRTAHPWAVELVHTRPWLARLPPPGSALPGREPIRGEAALGRNPSRTQSAANRRHL